MQSPRTLSLLRPTHWGDVIGQDKAITIIKAVLSRSSHLPLGWLFEGVLGVGKTTTAYITARALLCTSGNPLGCEHTGDLCPSCRVFDESPIHDTHPDFVEIDAASHSGVAEARELVGAVDSLPVIGRHRVIVIDEAHRLSREAWDVYLKPLEKPESQTVMIFATNDSYRIPKTIKSRLTKIPFTSVSPKTIHGYLAAVSAKYKLPYENDGLRLIARYSKGHIRDALQMLDKASALGTVSIETVRMVVDTSTDDQCMKILLLLARGSIQEAIELSEVLVSSTSAPRVVEKLFSVYSRAVIGSDTYTDEEKKTFAGIKISFPRYRDMSEVFLKWSATQTIPGDVIPILLMELSDLGDTSRRSRRPAEPDSKAEPIRSATPPQEHNPVVISTPGEPITVVERVLSPREVAKMLGATMTTLGKH